MKVFRAETYFCLRRIATLPAATDDDEEVSERLKREAESHGLRRFNPDGRRFRGDDPMDAVACLAEEGLTERALEIWAELCARAQETRKRRFDLNLQTDKLVYSRSALFRALVLEGRLDKATEILGDAPSSERQATLKTVTSELARLGRHASARPIVNPTGLGAYWNWFARLLPGTPTGDC